MRPPSSLLHLDFHKYSSHILPCHQMNNNVSNPITSHPSINIITIPPKFLRKKHVNTYTPVIYDNVDKDLYVFKSFGKSMKRSLFYTPRPRFDLSYGTNLLMNRNFFETFILGMMSMPQSTTSLSIS